MIPLYVVDFERQRRANHAERRHVSLPVRVALALAAVVVSAAATAAILIR